MYDWELIILPTNPVFHLENCCGVCVCVWGGGGGGGGGGGECPAPQMKPCNNKIQSSYWAWNKAYTGIRMYTQQWKHIRVDTLVLLEPNPYPNSLRI